MRQSPSQPLPVAPDAETAVVLTDDGGSGLFDACRFRFAEPEFEVECDATHTVWVKRAGGSRSVGLPLWLLRQHPLGEVLERVEKKLARPNGDK